MEKDMGTLSRGDGISQNLGARITLKPKKWVRSCALCALGSAAPVETKKIS